PRDRYFSSHSYAAPRNLHSFPTRRSSDLKTFGSGPNASARGPAIAARRRAPRRSQRRTPDMLILTCPYCGVAADETELAPGGERSEEHTSELQSRSDLVCRLLLEKKKTI